MFLGLNRHILHSLVICLMALAGAGSAAAEAVDRPPFEEWLQALRDEAVAAGISADTVDLALADVTFDEKVVRNDRNQPEVKLTLEKYLSQRLSAQRIAKGREMMETHREDLAQVGAKFGVQPRFIVAIWGLETNYGGYTGNHNIIQALVTLAYDPRRADFFRKELLAALRILDEGHVELADMKGSWAGAMGQPQFMPTSFNAYAVDFDGDGRRDIWTTPVDVFASIASYLKTYGWDAERTWGRQVLLADDTSRRLEGKEPPAKSCALRNHVGYMQLDGWQELGVRRLNGGDLPHVAVNASLTRPDGPTGRAYLTYANYRSILRYNCSDFYAIAVGSLADELHDLEQAN